MTDAATQAQMNDSLGLHGKMRRPFGLRRHSIRDCEVVAHEQRCKRSTCQRCRREIKSSTTRDAILIHRDSPFTVRQVTFRHQKHSKYSPTILLDAVGREKFQLTQLPHLSVAARLICSAAADFQFRVTHSEFKISSP